jgi:hypothetical protein
MSVSIGLVPQSSNIAEMASNPKYTLHKVETEADMSRVLDVIWAACYDPYDSFVQLIFPVLGYTRAACEAAIVGVPGTGE